MDVFPVKGAPALHLFCDVQLCQRTGAGNCAACTSLRRAYELGPGSGTLRIGPISLTAYDSLTSGSCTGVSWTALWGTLLVLLALPLI
ncbi:hypothetical protein NDU88_001848 [Pleurodeles waltl]|uniref:ZP domain-containing protein n=2 Tax=Pleurodeles waltl TaxID=8319 RepID=A0AAV7TKW3_PLEWA|nr:hypothetical protein NDU88_001848 [Pleurodeles waltl]